MLLAWLQDNRYRRKQGIKFTDLSAGGIYSSIAGDQIPVKVNLRSHGLQYRNGIGPGWPVHRNEKCAAQLARLRCRIFIQEIMNITGGFNSNPTCATITGF
jgi:hypothetical protein